MKQHLDRRVLYDFLLGKLDAIAALFCLRRAVEARQVSLALLGELGTYLERVQREPELVFRPRRE